MLDSIVHVIAFQWACVQFTIMLKMAADLSLSEKDARRFLTSKAPRLLVLLRNGKVYYSITCKDDVYACIWIVHHLCIIVHAACIYTKFYR